METNKSDSNGKYSSSDSSPKPSTNGDLQTDDFLIEFFPELKVPEEHSFLKDKKEMQQEENMVNGHRSLIDDLSIQNEKLKLMNKELKEKNILQDSQIAKYEADLSEKMQDFLTANQELEEVKEAYEDLKSKKEKIEKENAQFQVQMEQVKEVKEKSNLANSQILELQKNILSKEKAQRKLKNELETTTQKLVEKNGHVKKMKSANKKLWNFIMEMSETLSKNGLLTVKRKEQFLKEIDDQISIPEFSAEGEGIKLLLCGLVTSPAASSNGTPLATQSDNRIPSNSSELVNSPGSSTERQQSHYSAIVNASAENCVTSNIKSYRPNYFMKTHKDVIEDLVSEDYNELNNFRQQLSVRNDPISPLPPTPPPKSAKFKADDSQPAKKSSVFAGKSLNFFHQQSESFEVQNVESVEKPLSSSSTCTTPTLASPSQYTISSKLNHDGSLKLDFSAIYDTHLSFDMNTRKVSCTVMPSPQVPTDCSRLSDSRASSHCIPSEYSTPQTASQHPSCVPLKSHCLETMSGKCISGIKKIGSIPSRAHFVNDERNPKKIKLDVEKNLSKKIPVISSPKQTEKGSVQQNDLNFAPGDRGVPFSTNNLSHEKKTLNDIGRSGKIYSAFVSPSEKQVTIPSVRVSPRQLKAVSSNLECRDRLMEVDNHQQSPAEIHDSTNNNKSPKKRRKRSKKIKDSEDLFQSSTSKSKRKNNRIAKKRKTLHFNGEKSDALLDEKNKCSDSNNEGESKVVQGSTSPPSCLESGTMLQKDNMPSDVHKELPVRETSDHFEGQCLLKEDVKSSNVVEENSPVSEVSTKLLTVQSNKLNNDIDFSDIQVCPFNPSTFVPRGLFGKELSNLEDAQKPDVNKADDSSVLRQVDALQTNGELVPSCLKSPSKESSQKLNNIVSTVPSGAADNNTSAADSYAVSAMSNGHLVSNALNSNDGLDSDHSLVIAESGEDAEQNVAASGNAENSVSPRKKGAKKGRQSAKRPPVKKGVRKKESPEVVDAVTIAAAFEALGEMKFNDLHFKQNQHTLVNALINPNNAAGTKEVVCQVLKYLVSTRANPLLNYLMSENEGVLMPLTEKCIVQALFQVSKKKKSRLHGLMLSVVNTAYEMILAKESLQIYGLGCLCRVLTEICRWLEDKRRPLMLCSELLKFRHKFAPYLIASVVGVWKELFSFGNVSDEEMIFHSSIVYGTQKKPATLNEQQWKQCNNVLSAHLSAQFPYQINEMVTFLVHTIESKCIKDSFENEFILTTPLVVFTAVEGWNWAKEILIDEHIIPLLVKFSEQEVNEKAFTVFCQLYADICYFCPNEEDPHEVFEAFFNNELVEGNEFVKHASAMAQIKLLLHKKQLLPQHLTEWIGQIQHKPDYVEYAERLFQRRLMNDTLEILESEVRL